MLRVLLFLLLAGALASCASAPTTLDGTDQFPPTAEAESLTLPFDAYTMSLADMYTILNAEDVLMHTCMKAQGYEFDILKRPTEVKDLRNRRRYGAIEPDIARFGYHVPAGLLSPESVDTASTRRDDLMNEGAKAAAGGPGGCAAKAFKQISPDGGPDLNRLTGADSASLKVSQKDPRVMVAMHAWRDCMRQSGLAYSAPLDAMADPRWWGPDSLEPSPEEIRVATADVGCKSRTGLVEVWHAADAAIQRNDITGAPESFATIRDELDKQLDTARTVVATS